MSAKSLAAKATVPTVILGGAGLYLIHYIIGQVHWAVGHMMTLMIILSMLAGVVIVVRRARTAIRDLHTEEAPPREPLPRPNPAIDYARIVEEWTPSNIDAEYERVMKAARR